MLERALLAAGVIALLVFLSYAARLLWDRRRRRLVARLRAGGETAAGARILYFSTPYCVTCRELQEPALNGIAGLGQKPIVIEKVDPLEQPDLARRYQVVTVPTTAVFDDEGQLVEINYGYAPLARLAEQLGLELPAGAAARYEI